MKYVKKDDQIKKYFVFGNNKFNYNYHPKFKTSNFISKSSKTKKIAIKPYYICGLIVNKDEGKLQPCCNNIFHKNCLKKYYKSIQNDYVLFEQYIDHLDVLHRPEFKMRQDY